MRTTAKEYIGALPDDLSKRLIFFLKAKSSYATYIKEATLTRVIVFIREEKKGKQVMSQVSFPQNIQKKLDEFVLHNADEKEEEGVLEEQDEHMEGWEKMAAENPILEEKDLLIDIQRDDLEDEE